MRFDVGLVTLAGAAALLVAACGDGDDGSATDAVSGDLGVEGAVMGEPPGPNAAVYFEISNSTGVPDVLVSVSTSLEVEMVSLHTSVTDGDRIEMQVLADGIPVPGGEVTRLRPGGRHVMLVGLADELLVGDIVPIELHFASGTTIPVDASVVRFADLPEPEPVEASLPVEAS